MGKFFKTVLLFLLCQTAIIGLAVSLFLIFTADCEIDENKLKQSSPQIVFYDDDSNEIILAKRGEKTSRDDVTLPDYVKNAFVAVEDKRFYSHSGIDVRALLRAALADVRSGSLKEGGSTISQQLVKNTHLSSEKTLARKLKELRLTLKLERRYKKDVILNFYLDGIYFGNGAYGIESAARLYYSEKASELSLSQAAALAATVKAPSLYKPGTEAGEKRRRLVLKLLSEQNYISNEEYEKAIAEEPQTSPSLPNDYFTLAREELYKKCDVSPYEKQTVRVYTYYDKKAQKTLDELSESSDEIVVNGLIASSFGEIQAIKLPYGSCVCNPASTIKPLLVYAPAFNEGFVSTATPVDDSPVTFGDYSPTELNGVYRGYVSAKQCLAKSLNVPAVKILNGLGVEKAIGYAKKTGLSVSESALTAALGCYDGGEDFIKLCAAYTVFTSDGVYRSPKIIKSVRIGRLTVYKAKDDGVKVYKSGTADLVNECLKECAKTGTARALSDFDFEICAKTGTNGTKNGNTDALSIVYTSENIIGVCLKPRSGLLDCKITGAYATRDAVSVIEKLYANQSPRDFTKSENVVKKRLCSLAYEDGELLLAPDEQPDKYCFVSEFLTEYVPERFSDKYLSPAVDDYTVDLSDNRVTIKLTKKSVVRCRVIRQNENGEKAVCDLQGDEFNDCDLKDGKYVYYIEPYIKTGLTEQIGKKIKIAEVLINEKERFAKDENWEED